MEAHFYKKRKNSGIGLVEVVLASAIILLIVVSVVESYAVYINFALTNQNNVQANFILEEGVESVLFLRDGGWSTNISTLTASTTYYLYFNGTTWQSTSTQQYIDSKFLRSFVLNNVNRDANDDIAVSGTNDPNTKKFTVTVAYPAGHSTTTKSMSTYITNINGD